MLHEYAIAPSLLSYWALTKRDYTEFLREYGLGSPRVVSCFPKTRSSKLRSYFLRNGPADSQSLQSQRYVVMVEKLLETLVVRENTAINDDEWEHQVLIENSRIPFNIILSKQSLGVDHSLTPDSMYDADSPWNHEVQKDIIRTKKGFSEAVYNMLRLSTKQVVIIDPYGWTDEATDLVTYLINNMSIHRVSSRLPYVQLFYKQHTKSPNASFVKKAILEGIETGMSLDVKVYELEETPNGDVFHNRCILTEHGGISTGHGIGVSEKEVHTDEAFLMKPRIYQKKWDQFIEGNNFTICSQA
ncbi:MULTISPECIES: hypothetical protein [unclassified Endozoicomonas]|uniref:hypothetical protein n=1 Tax=unclassified Endozoicomonas TaxID=2644528 RepID=UPI003BB7559E